MEEFGFLMKEEIVKGTSLYLTLVKGWNDIAEFDTDVKRV